MLSCWFKAMKCLIRYFSVSLEYGTVMIVTKRMTNVLLSCDALNSLIVTLRGHFIFSLQSVSWILAEFYFNRGLQRLYTGTCIILQKTINGFLCLLIVFLKSKTYQLILKEVIKLNRNLR